MSVLEGVATGGFSYPNIDCSFPPPPSTAIATAAWPKHSPLNPSARKPSAASSPKPAAADHSYLTHRSGGACEPHGSPGGADSDGIRPHTSHCLFHPVPCPVPAVQHLPQPQPYSLLHHRGLNLLPHTHSLSLALPPNRLTNLSLLSINYWAGRVHAMAARMHSVYWRHYQTKKADCQCQFSFIGADTIRTSVSVHI